MTSSHRTIPPTHSLPRCGTDFFATESGKLSQKNRSFVTRKASFVLALMLSAGCAAYTASLESSFFSKFSLRELVERNKSQDLNCSAGGTGGGGGGRSFGSKESHSQKGESLSCQITDAEKFDEGKFLQALRQSVEMDLEESKARNIGCAKVDEQSFSCEYALEDIRGKVEVSGKMGPGNYYSLKANLDERTGEAK
jgi:hypothetical protein